KDTPVSIVRGETEKDEVTETIAFSTEEKNDSSLPKGEKRDLSEGKEGKVEKVYEIVKENGKEVSKELVDEYVIEESEDRVVAIGTKQKEDNNLVTLST
ncbi:G5 domain-containing protein, partial [Virgibacillus salexigens]|uniref:G5 domain-containing protein n=1 Tax=Virgibacillus salexigens TaxID=61016 RepID=UPI00190C217B